MELYNPLLREGSMPSSRCQHETNLVPSWEFLHLVMSCQGVSPIIGPLCMYYAFQFCFCGILGVYICVSASICVSFVFSLVLFLLFLFVCFVLSQFAFFNFFYYSLDDVCFLRKDIKGVDGKGRGNGKNLRGVD